MTTDFDIIVIGAGPAGATFARLVAETYRVLLVDKDAGKEKCCGGLIAPDAQALLASFDIGVPKSVIADPQLLYVRSIDLRTKEERCYQRHYTNVQRGAFDRYLLSLVPSAAARRLHCRYVGHRQNGNSVTVTLQTGGELETFTCKLLVGADGAYSRVRKDLFGDFSDIRKYLAIQGMYERLSEISHYAVFFDKAITDFYSWLIPKDDVVLVGGAFPLGGRPRSRYDRLVAAIGNVGYDLGPLRNLTACFVIRLRWRDLKAGFGRVALFGEAAGFISPSSAEGLSYAYKNAVALMKSLQKGDDGWLVRYKKHVTSLKLSVLLKTVKSACIYTGALRNFIFRTKIGTLEKN